MDDRIGCDEERLEERRSTGQAVRKQECQRAARLNVWRPLHCGPFGHYWRGSWQTTLQRHRAGTKAKGVGFRITLAPLDELAYEMVETVYIALVRVWTLNSRGGDPARGRQWAKGKIFTVRRVKG